MFRAFGLWRNKMRPRRATEKAKHESMRKLLTALREGPLTTKKALKILPVQKRMVQKYFQALMDLGLVRYNKEARAYELVGLRKKVFNSIADRQQALEHARTLIFSTEYNQRLDLTEPFLVVNNLVFSDVYPGSDIDDQGLTSHIKTGYPRVWALMQKYRQLAEKHIIENWKLKPNTRVQRKHLNRVSRNRILTQAFQDGFEIISDIGEKPRGGSYKEELSNQPEHYADMTAETPSEIVAQASTLSVEEARNKRGELQAQLVAEIYRIVNRVRNGIALDGVCDYCPDRYQTTKD